MELIALQNLIAQQFAKITKSIAQEVLLQMDAKIPISALRKTEMSTENSVPYTVPLNVRKMKFSALDKKTSLDALKLMNVLQEPSRTEEVISVDFVQDGVLQSANMMRYCAIAKSILVMVAQRKKSAFQLKLMSTECIVQERITRMNQCRLLMDVPDFVMICKAMHYVQ